MFFSFCYDQLDENINLETLEKAIAYMTNVYSTHFSTICNGITLLTDQAKVLSVASDGLLVDCHRINLMMQVRIFIGC